jgi:uncharacterized protein (UPF0335 family)
MAPVSNAVLNERLDQVLDRLERLEGKVDRAAEFQSVFNGAVKILGWAVGIGAALTTIVVGVHGSIL